MSDKSCLRSPKIHIPAFPPGVILRAKHPACVLVVCSHVGLRTLIVQELKKFGYTNVFVFPEDGESSDVTAQYEVEYAVFESQRCVETVGWKFGLKPIQCISLNIPIEGCQKMLILHEHHPSPQDALRTCFGIERFGH